MELAKLTLLGEKMTEAVILESRTLRKTTLSIDKKVIEVFHKDSTIWWIQNQNGERIQLERELVQCVRKLLKTIKSQGGKDLKIE